MSAATKMILKPLLYSGKKLKRLKMAKLSASAIKERDERSKADLKMMQELYLREKETRRLALKCIVLRFENIALFIVNIVLRILSCGGKKPKDY